jgi:hypothetical protein
LSPFDDFGQLLARQLRLAERQGVAAVALIARAIPLVAELAARLGLEYVLAELDLPRLLRRLRQRCGAGRESEDERGE